jgi:hypothetical protein
VVIFATTPGAVVAHDFDKTSIPEAERPANYATLAPVVLANGTDVEVAGAGDPYVLRLLYVSGRYVWQDMARVLAAPGGWVLVAASNYITAPTSPTTITTTVDYSSLLNVGDVLKIELVGTGVQYNLIEALGASTITVSGIPLDADIATIYYDKGNRARIQSLVFEADDDEIFVFGEDRPERSTTAGGAAAVPANPYGTDMFFAQRFEAPQGSQLVSARATLGDAGSSATALVVGVGFGSQAGYACEITCSGIDNSPASIVRTYATVPTSNLLDGCDIITNAGNLDAHTLLLHLQFFVPPN